MPRPNISQNLILNALAPAENRMLRFGDLVKATQLSETTVSKVLKKLQKENKVERIVDSTSKVYPPPVYYKTLESEEIVQKRIITAQLWEKKNRELVVTMNEVFELFRKLGREGLRELNKVLEQYIKQKKAGKSTITIQLEETASE